MPRPKADCKQCDGTGELYVKTGYDYRGEPEEHFTYCDCISEAEPVEAE